MLAKVCGLTRSEDARHAQAAGADLLGFVRHPASPRHCRDLALATRGLESVSVLVTVGHELDDLALPLSQCGLARVQPHVPQSEREKVVTALRQRGFWVLLPWPDVPNQPVIEADLYLWEPDPKLTGVAGGSGMIHPMAYPPPGPFLLAGGLDAATIRLQLDSVPPQARPLLRGADAASRLEGAPGVKDPQKVSAFLQALKTWPQPLSPPSTAEPQAQKR